MSHVADSPKNRHFQPISGRFTPIWPTNHHWQRPNRIRSRRAAVYIQYVTEPGNFFGQINPFLPARRRPPVDHSLSWPEALNASRFKRACRMARRRNACSLLALLDFPEFAQAVKYGVLASGKLWEGALDYLQSHPFCKKETLGS